MYNKEMAESIKKVEANRKANTDFEPRRMTAEEKDTLLATYHPDYKQEEFRTLTVGPNKGGKVPTELAALLQAHSRIDPAKIDLSRVDLLVYTGGAKVWHSKDPEIPADANALYDAKEAELSEAGMDVREIERVVLLSSVDRHWMNHIDDMDQLRQGIGLAAYGQKDPKVMYKMEGYDMFNAMTSSIQEDTLKMMYHVKVQEKVEREEVAKVTGTNRDDTAVRAPKKREKKKIYPNDPCWCGSGKKYKQCHMRSDMAGGKAGA